MDKVELLLYTVSQLLESKILYSIVFLTFRFNLQTKQRRLYGGCRR